MSNPTQIMVSGGNLFQIAAQYLSDATQWYRLAQVNGLPPDPLFSGRTSPLVIPPADPTGGNGGILYQ